MPSFGMSRQSRLDRRATQVRQEGFEFLADQAPWGEAIVDMDGEVVASNPAYNTMMSRGAGRAIRQALGRSSGIVRARYQVDVQCTDRDDRTWWCRLIAYPYRAAGGETYEAHHLEDVTEQKRTQATIEAVRVQLALMTAGTMALAEARSPDKAIPALLRAVCEDGHWSFAAFWAVISGEQILRCRYMWSSPDAAISAFKAATQTHAVPLGGGLVGQAWHNGHTTWLQDVERDGQYSRVMLAEREGLHSALAFPVLLDGEVCGVVEFWSEARHGRIDGFEDAMSTLATQLGDHLGRFLEREQIEEHVRASEERYRSITEIAHDAIITMDENSVMLSVNAAVERTFGYSRNELMGRSLTMLMPENLRESHLTGLKRYCLTGARHVRWENLEMPGLCKDGTTILLEVSLAEMKVGGRRTFTGYMHDITERKHEESALVYQALHDTLTDLPNRVLLQERLERGIVIAQRHKSSMALLFMDLDRFKEVNDSFGHHSGDLLLQQVANRLVNTLRESDTVARLGGDEFALMLPNTDEPGAALAAHRIMDTMRQPFTLNDQPFEVGASIGISFCPEHGTDVATLMRRADVAMYAAKRAGTGYTVYSAERDEANAMRLLLTGELRRALEENQLFLHYQPKISIKDGTARNVEALIRWQHPERGYIPPDGFIPLAEETGLVKPLTVWLLVEALRQHQQWKREGLDIRISVNFSAKTLHDADLVETVYTLLKDRAIEPSTLQIEITESALMLNPERALETLTKLHNAGVWTSIDDFGTGYSSLGYLKQLPVDEIKIDKSFVIDMANNRDDASIVRSVVTLGHNLGLEVVAEGVENKRVYDMLAAMECDLAQGYFLSRPLPPLEATEFLRGRGASKPAAE